VAYPAPYAEENGEQELILKMHERIDIMECVVTVIMTCHNRKDKTLKCLATLEECRALLQGFTFRYVVVDDGSTDGTGAAVRAFSDRVSLVEGNGSLYYTGGMRLGIERAKEVASDYYMLINDDVAFDSVALAGMLKGCRAGTSCDGAAMVLVGPTKTSSGDFSYGGIRYVKGIHYEAVRPGDSDRRCDTFNANCVLVPEEVFLDVPNMDGAYNHSLGDFDYGLQIKRKGYEIRVHDAYIGVCDKNTVRGTWNDTGLSRRERLRRKESLKGLPRREWFHFLNKNFGFFTACVRSVTPYVRIMLGR
jgi:GT2 family glycosyltransferase